MTEPLPRMTGTPALAVDPLTDVLRLVHVASAVFMHGHFSAPWALLSPPRDDLVQVLQPGARNLVLFHVVVDGHCHVQLDTGDSALARAGEVALLPYAHRHRMGNPGDADPVPVVELLPPPPWASAPVLRHGGGGDGTRILCGYLRCEQLLFNPMLQALPPLIHLRLSSAAADWLRASVRYIDERAQDGATHLIERLPEVMLVDCLRQYAQALPPQQTGWLAALRDPVVGRALALLHERPAHDWSVDELARCAATSRSVLGERFRALLKVSPMHYLTQWRMQLAAQTLDSQAVPVSVLAERVGYQSEAAFSRAFKRCLGCAPSEWRAGRSAVH
jgi:AraC family transcriptional regulator, alkane utilization regulator